MHSKIKKLLYKYINLYFFLKYNYTKLKVFIYYICLRTNYMNYYNYYSAIYTSKIFLKKY